MTAPTLRAVTPTIGAEVVGIDLGCVDDEAYTFLADALARHLVLFFRDQEISVEAHKALGRRFGDLLECGRLGVRDLLPSADPLLSPP